MINKNDQKVMSTTDLLAMLSGVQGRYDELSKVVLVIEPSAIEYFKGERDKLVEDAVKLLEEASKTQATIDERCKKYKGNDNQPANDEAVEAYSAGIRTCEFICDEVQTIIHNARSLTFGPEQDAPQPQ